MGQEAIGVKMGRQDVRGIELPDIRKIIYQRWMEKYGRFLLLHVTRCVTETVVKKTISFNDEALGVLASVWMAAG